MPRMVVPAPDKTGKITVARREFSVSLISRQFREQASRFRQCVEGGEELAICDEGLKHPPREVVIGSRTQLRQAGDGSGADSQRNWR